VELQGTAEHGAFSRGTMDELLTLAEKGIEELLQVQKEAFKK
jgi:ribonuclease PH